MDAEEESGMLQTIQIGLNSSDIAGTARLYSELFGFVNAGGNLIWGEPMRLQGLEPDARGQMHWLVGGQSFFQIELFHHTKPLQRPLRTDWRPSDLGWTRFGVAVADYDAVVRGLDRWGIAPSGRTAAPRRLAFRDPFVGCFIEVIEGPSDVGECAFPALCHVTGSVADLAGARIFYQQTLQLPIAPLADLHTPADEALWGLAGAGRDGFVVEAGMTRLEIVQYANPAGRSRPADYRTVDQGIANIGLGTRARLEAEAAIERLRRAGCSVTPNARFGEAVAAYVLDEGREIEVISIPELYDAEWGFIAGAPFLGSTGE